MKRRLLLFVILYYPFLALQAQVQDITNYRTISGMHNNLDNPSWGAAHTNLLQVTELGFSDGYGALGGTTRPNPREISNDLFSQTGVLNDLFGLSDFVWAWGQFLDHDIGLTVDGPEPLIIQVPVGDPHFDPFGMGQAIIPMQRNAIAAGTGTGEGNPRQYVNEITAFIDGSNVYGSDLEASHWLRTFSEGKLKVSTGNRLPYNTTSGEFEDPIDPDAPHMDNPTGISDVISVAGDPRAGENPLLTSLHTLFVREHNRQCDIILKDYPDWTDEQVYQHARKIVGGLIQSIVYDEWLPSLGLVLPAYSGYNQERNPQLMNVFTAAAFRLGHTLLTSTIQRLDNDGNVIPQGNISLRDAFFNPFVIQETGGIDPFFKGMAVQMQQRFDAKVIDDIRNFLFGPPGAGGLDLASININRGRERGLPDFNTVRENFGLPAYNFFQQINPDAAVFTRLLSIYADIDDIDPWVGMLAERPVPGSIFGSTLYAILTQQFTALRNGDRFFYLNDPVLTEEEKTYITTTTLRDIIMYNTDIDLMQDDVFGALPHEEICDNMTFSLGGQVRTATGVPVPNVTVELSSVPSISTDLTAAEGTYSFPDMPYCDLQLLLPVKDDDPINGVSTFDIIQIQKHILGTDLLESPYQQIAADINASGTISTIDLIRLRKLILGIDTDFGENTSWRFVLGAFEFPEGENPLQVDFPEYVDFASEHAANYNSGFVAIKVGDVNNSVDLDEFNQVEERYLATGLELRFADQEVAAGDVVLLNVELSSEEALLGWQFALSFDNADLLSVEESSWDEAHHYATSESLRVSYNESAPLWANGLLQLRVRARENGKLSDFITWDSSLKPEAYSGDQKTLGISLIGEERTANLWLGQNEPNPFRQQTRIPFEIASADQVRLSVFTVDGKLVYEAAGEFDAGRHFWQVEGAGLGAAGLYYYRLDTSAGTETRSMIIE